MPIVSVAKLKSQLSEVIANASYNKQKFIITRRNKPVAALVSIDDLRIIEQYEQRKGLASLTGKWKGFEEVAEHIDDLASIRKAGGCGRDVSI